MTERTEQQKKDEFLKRLADLLEEFDVKFDLDDDGTGWEVGSPKLTLTNRNWSSDPVFTGHLSFNAADIRQEIGKE